MTPATPSKTASDPAAIGEDQLRAMAAAIRAEIPGAEVRLFGSRARGEARPDSDVDLLITAPDAWLAQQDRFALLGRLWDQLAHHSVPVDLLLYSRSQVEERSGWRSHVIARACREGRLLDGQP
ncbi:MAG: nucleotidyltransferase domain-containing protein [Synechococcaceae cyanobacterium]|nr:nucleotidyltransferase domain-containing protein [Synechococcaceae cyanobacterium]